MAHKRQVYHPRQNKSKHLLQIEQGGLGTDSLSEAADTFGLLKSKDLNIPNGAAIVGVTGTVTKDYIDGGEILPEVPIVNGPAMVRAGEPYEYVITNYDSFTDYVLTSRNGTAVLSGDKVIFTGEYPGDASFTLNEVKYPITVGNLDIGQPAIFSPVNGSIRIELELTLVSSSFSSSGGTDTHRSSDWQISKTLDFSDIVKESYQDSINLTEWVIEGLEYEKKYYVRTRHYGAAPGPGSWSNVVEFTTRPETYIIEPTVEYPVNGTEGVSRSATFVGSAFAVYKGTDTHESTDWEISADEIFSALIASSIGNAVDKTSWTSPTLPNNAVMYVRLRYNGHILGNGRWSIPSRFKTVAVLVNTPSITHPSAGGNLFMNSPTIQASSYSIQNGPAEHLSSDWQLSSTSDFSSILAESLADTTNKTKWTPPSISLNNTYYVRVRYNGPDGKSQWSPISSFTYIEQIPPLDFYRDSGSGSVSIENGITSITVTGKGGNGSSSVTQVWVPGTPGTPTYGWASQPTAYMGETPGHLVNTNYPTYPSYEPTSAGQTVGLTYYVNDYNNGSPVYHTFYIYYYSVQTGTSGGSPGYWQDSYSYSYGSSTTFTINGQTHTFPGGYGGAASAETKTITLPSSSSYSGSYNIGSGGSIRIQHNGLS